MRVQPVEGRRRPLGLRAWLIGAVILLVLLLFSLRGLAHFYTDYLWFQDVGYTRTWRSLISAKAVPAIIFSTIFFVLMLVNLIVADRVAPRYRGTGPEDEIIERYRGYVAPYAGRVRVGVSLFFALVMGSGVAAQWQNWILFSNSTSFGVKDPEFHKDISFYVFRLPFLQFVAGWTFAALLVVLIVTAVWHYLNGGIRLQSGYQRVTAQVKVHLSVLLALMSLTKTAQYYLEQFALALSHRGFVQGATYTDVHAELPALRLLMLISVTAAVLFIINIWRKGWVFPIIAVGLWGFISIVIGTIVPAAIQRITVQPNELSREQPYIARNIEATRAAFNLANIATPTFNYTETLNASDVNSSQPTLNNVRLYDPPPAGNAFEVQQAITPFYAFSDVDVDRYTVGVEKSKPALVSVRELDTSHLPDNSWTSQHLVYTHGYGAVAAAADEVDADQPSYLLSNIPPTGDQALQIDPKYTGVYFGEGANGSFGGYAVVDTKVQEQEASSASGTTKTTQYSGKAGVAVSSFLRKAALALRFGDWNLFVSGQLTDQSRVIFIRDIRQRVQTIAPFLRYDADPYPVILNGRITWVMDAYTVSNNYPYSERLHPDEDPASGLDMQLNYARNSVKVTVDAYDGTVHFYIVDPKDPIAQTYKKAFPELFTDSKDMPAGLQDHFRYPEDIFKAQTEVYTTYHITDPVQFFNKQAIWDITQTPAASTVTAPVSPSDNAPSNGRSTTLPASTAPIAPLYLTMQIPSPEGTGQEFVLERSFTPRRKGGILSAFVFARSDPAHYGQLVVYQLPTTAAPSPSQAASVIESDQFVSSQFTLLSSAGSQVLRGDVQLIPIGNTILYIRPVWILGEGSSTFPRYKFTAASLGNKAVLGFNVQDAVTALLTGRSTQLQQSVQRGQSITDIVGNPTGNNASTTTTLPSTTPPPTATPGTAPPSNASATTLLQSAQTQFAAAEAALAAGNLGGYQSHVQAAQADVKAAAAKLGSASSSTPTSTPTPAAKTTPSTASP